ncbi:MAG: hypothetical protein R3E12_03085 [Candidatus Eisenbacteria bacterium]|uniref:Lamin tail domain-containing protein n=1 Tax=Eiseniibacteriota bacterium TaxID=2212470 RepID=A0A956RP00_UNCEI|nr:hypothetical protein [Candidatus Eisenbacteria bacterium]
MKPAPLFAALLACGLAIAAPASRAELPDVDVTVNPADALEGLVFSPTMPSPAPASVNTITIRNASNQPMPGVLVEVVRGGPWNLCSGVTLMGITDAAGRAVITLGGGGMCLDDVGSASLITANGVTVRRYSNVKSPDFDGVSGNLRVDLPDLVQFSSEFLDHQPNRCHDYDNNENTGLEDVIIFGSAFTAGASCAP